MTRLFALATLLAGLWAAAFNAAANDEGNGALNNDIAVIQKSRQGMEAIVAYMAGKPDIFPAKAPSQLRDLTPQQRQEVRDLWGRFLDNQLVLDAAWQRLRGQKQEDAFRVGYAAFLTRYRYALDFIALADADPAVRVVLNEPLPELGLPARSYADFKFRFLNVAIAAEFATLSANNRNLGKASGFALADAMDKDEQRIWKAGKGDGVANTLRNAGQIVQDGGLRMVFPVQKNVSEWMGDTRVLYGKRYLITDDQVAASLAPKLQPGDVLLERREWFLSNIGLPGFWPHAALYVGTAEERAAYFNDGEVRAWLASQGIASGDFEALLKKRFPAAYGLSQTPDEHSKRPRLLEAMSEGVVFTSIEHSGAADAVAVLRPRLSRLEVAKALVKAFGYQGRPYDFDFDFRTDATLVCSELVYKAYRPDNGQKGLDLPLRTVAGRPVLTPNDIAQIFDETWGTPRQQFDLVVFLDGQLTQKRAVEADVAHFRASWHRPKWHILTQNTPFAAR